MPELIIQEIEEEVVSKLKERAERHGVSMEEEHRRILREALLGKAKRSFKEALLAMPNVGETAILSETDSWLRRPSHDCGLPPSRLSQDQRLFPLCAINAPM